MPKLEELLHEALNPRTTTTNVALARFGAKEPVRRIVELLMSLEGIDALQAARGQHVAAAIAKASRALGSNSSVGHPCVDEGCEDCHGH